MDAAGKNCTESFRISRIFELFEMGDSAFQSKKIAEKCVNRSVKVIVKIIKIVKIWCQKGIFVKIYNVIIYLYNI